LPQIGRRITIFRENQEDPPLGTEAVEERYHALFDFSLQAVYIHDFEGRFIDANSAALKMLGYDRADVPSLRLSDLLESE
jgi:PAS domain S-box-containing protein